MEGKYKDDTEFGKENPAFENDSEQRDTANNFSSSNGDENLTMAEDEESGPKRPQWASGTDFFMAALAMSVGLGNVYRFPYIAYDNGGGAFLIPYIVIHILIGKPIYYVEACIGQFVSRGPIKVWAISPALKGIGYGQIFATVMVLLYYCSLIAITGFYLVHSFYEELPWSTCDHDWVNADTCFPSRRTDGNHTNITKLSSSSELFFYEYVMNEPDNIDDGIGDPDWRLVIGLLVAWVILFLIVIRGLRSIGKVSYFLAVFPYLVMLVLLIHGSALPGAGRGVEYFFKPTWDKLLDAQVWYNAVTQVFFSLYICFGTLIMYASFNPFKHNVYRDAMIITTLDMVSSVLAGITIFCILGNVVYERNLDEISSIVQRGPGLAFVSYSKAIAKMYAVPQFFAVIFFIMLYAVGAGTAVALLAGVIYVICDSFPNSKYLLLAFVISVLGFVGGLLYVTPGGLYMLTLVDFYGASYSVFVLATVEVVALAWIYGVNNLLDDFEFMLGMKTGTFTRFCVAFVTPVLMIIVLVYSFVFMEEVTYNNKTFPMRAHAAGWILFAFGVGQLPLWMLIVVMCRNRGESFLETIKSSFRSSEKWRPQSNAFYKEWKDFKERKRILLANESLWLKMVRSATGYSPLLSSAPESSNTQKNTDETVTHM